MSPTRMNQKTSSSSGCSPTRELNQQVGSNVCVHVLQNLCVCATQVPAMNLSASKGKDCCLAATLQILSPKCLLWPITTRNVGKGILWNIFQSGQMNTFKSATVHPFPMWHSYAALWIIIHCQAKKLIKSCFRLTWYNYIMYSQKYTNTFLKREHTHLKPMGLRNILYDQQENAEP